MKNSVLVVIFVASLLAVLALVVYRLNTGVQEETVTVTEPQVIPEEPAEPGIQHPIPEEVREESLAERPPLPPLDQGEEAVRQALPGVFEEKRFRDLLIPDNLIRRIVVTADNLSRDSLPGKFSATRRPEGSFLVTGQGTNLQIDPANYKRYKPVVDLLQAVSTEQFTSAYLYLYPLLQEAYVELGYPEGYFNDRLVEVIDHLLETPEVKEPIRLEQPKVAYTFADPELEKLSAGQKILIRMGPENAQAVREKLKEFRENIVQLPRRG